MQPKGQMGFSKIWSVSPRRRKSLLYSDNGSTAVRVTPGDALYERLAGIDRPLTVAGAVRQCWSVYACAQIIARAMSRLDLSDVMDDAEGVRPVREQRVAPMLVPHLHAMAFDLATQGEFIAIIADDMDKRPVELVRVAPSAVTIHGEGAVITSYSYGGKDYRPSEVFRVFMADPILPREALSPLTPILGVLVEDLAASKWRRDSWSGFRPGAIIERPIEAPEWDLTALRRFEEHMRGRSGGDVAVLEEGMRAATGAELPNASDAQYLESRRFAAEATASALGVPGVLLATGQDRQLGPARRQLLMDGVAPLTKLVEAAADELCIRAYGAQALNRRIRVAFDVPKALRQEDEDSSLRVNAVGTPYRTVNETRALDGLPPVEGGDVLASPAPRAVLTE